MHAAVLALASFIRLDAEAGVASYADPQIRRPDMRETAAAAKVLDTLLARQPDLMLFAKSSTPDTSEETAVDDMISAFIARTALAEAVTVEAPAALRVVGE